MLYIQQDLKEKLLSFKDVHQNEYHIKTLNKNNMEYLCIIKNVSKKKYILEKFPTFSQRLNYTIINVIESYAVMN